MVQLVSDSMKVEIEMILTIMKTGSMSYGINDGGETGTIRVHNTDIKMQVSCEAFERATVINEAICVAMYAPIKEVLDVKGKIMFRPRYKPSTLTKKEAAKLVAQPLGELSQADLKILKHYYSSNILEFPRKLAPVLRDTDITEFEKA